MPKEIACQLSLEKLPEKRKRPETQGIQGSTKRASSSSVEPRLAVLGDTNSGEKDAAFGFYSKEAYWKGRLFTPTLVIFSVIVSSLLYVFYISTHFMDSHPELAARLQPWERLRNPLRFLQRVSESPEDKTVEFPPTHDWECPNHNPDEQPTLYLLSGFIASGKSTYAKNVMASKGAIVFSPDEWIIQLYGADFPVSRFQEVGDFVKELIWLSAREVLGRYRKSVVLDFSLWTKSDRDWWRQRATEDSKSWFAHCSPDNRCSGLCRQKLSIELIYVDCPAEIARQRLIERNTGVMRMRGRDMSTDSHSNSIFDSNDITSPVGDISGEKTFGFTDDVSLFVPLELFDEWRQFLEPPKVEEEFPVTFINCPCELSLAQIASAEIGSNTRLETPSP